AQLPAAQRATLLTAMTQKFSALGQSQINQAAIPAVRAEYTALGVDTNALQNNTILRLGGLMLLVSLLSGVCTIAVGYFSARIAAGFARDLRRHVFRKVESFAKAEIDKFSTSSLITRSTNDITQIQTTVMMVIRMAIYAPLLGVGAIVMA